MFLSFSLIMMIHFQNCSQVNGELASASIAAQPDARISDDWRSADLVFAYKALETAEDLSSTAFYGLCRRQAQTKTLNWKVLEEGQALFEGQANCVHGNFELAFLNLQELPCGSPYKLTLQDMESGAEASMLVTRRCPALQSSVEPDGCRKERILTGEGQPSCELVCYDRGIVVQKEAHPLDQCPAAAP